MKVAVVKSSHKSSEDILNAFTEKDADIVILEYASGRAYKQGPWCHVFIHSCVNFVAERLWHEENWIKVNPLNAVIVCLYAPLSAAEVIDCMKQHFDNIELENTKQETR